MRMTKARQLSPEGGEKCGFFLRGGHAASAAGCGASVLARYVLK